MTNTPGRSNSRWLVVALLTLGIIIAYTDRINLSAALPAIRESFPLTAAASGVLLSAFFWAYTLLQTPAGWVVDRFGLKWPYAAAMLLWSAASAATALVSSVHGLIALRMVLGIGEAVAVPASMRYIRENFAERERGLPMGILMSGTKYGPAIGAPIATYLVMGLGWRWMFVLNGAFSVFWLVPWLFLVRDDQSTATVANEPEPATKVSWAAIFGSRVIWGTCLATFCYMYFVYFCMTWMPTYFKERFGFSLTASSWYTFMSFAGTGTIAILAGWAGELLGVDADAYPSFRLGPRGRHPEHGCEHSRDRSALDHGAVDTKDRKLQRTAGRCRFLAAGGHRLLSLPGQGEICLALAQRSERLCSIKCFVSTMGSTSESDSIEK